MFILDKYGDATHVTGPISRPNGVTKHSPGASRPCSALCRVLSSLKSTLEPCVVIPRAIVHYMILNHFNTHQLGTIS